MLNMVAFVVLVGLHVVPMWAVAIIICRELAVTGLRLLLVEQGGVVMAAAMPGKIKTATQMLSVIFLFIGNPLYIGTILFYVCVFFTIYSGYDYFAKICKFLETLTNSFRKNMKIQVEILVFFI